MGIFFSLTAKEKENKTNSKPKFGVSEKDKAILNLKNSRDRLKKYKKQLELDSGKLLLQAQQLIAKKQKQRALMVLKLKKYKTEEADKIDGQLFNVLQMIDTIEWESVNIQVTEALRAGTDALNRLHEQISVDEIAQLMDDTNEAIEVENQINAIFIGQIDASAEDEEMLAELDALMAGADAEANGTKTERVNVNLVLPEVPTTPLLPTAPTTINQSLSQPRTLAQA